MRVEALAKPGYLKSGWRIPTQPTHRSRPVSHRGAAQQLRINGATRTNLDDWANREQAAVPAHLVLAEVRRLTELCLAQ